jgi:hypothetical protein
VGDVVVAGQDVVVAAAGAAGDFVVVPAVAGVACGDIATLAVFGAVVDQVLGLAAVDVASDHFAALAAVVVVVGQLVSLTTADDSAGQYVEYAAPESNQRCSSCSILSRRCGPSRRRVMRRGWILTMIIGSLFIWPRSPSVV